MRRVIAAALLALAAGLALPTRAGELSALETRWLQGAWPVLQHARAQGLPLDVVVQPQPAAGLAPLALAFVDGRCKVVLSTRENPAAPAALAGLDPALHDAALELMAAHELGHCLRHLDGRWQRAPAGVTLPPLRTFGPLPLTDAQRADHAQMQATRIEEAYGDLAGLAWVRHRRPAQFAPLHRWLTAQRAAGLPGSHHDTRLWLRLVEDGGDALAGGTPFERVAEVWQRGLEQLAAEPGN